jgi:phosphoenolpyruvate synthase/pyruvate phosphate dikinase
MVKGECLLLRRKDNNRLSNYPGTKEAGEYLRNFLKNLLLNFNKEVWYRSIDTDLNQMITECHKFPNYLLPNQNDISSGENLLLKCPFLGDRGIRWYKYEELKQNNVTYTKNKNVFVQEISIINDLMKDHKNLYLLLPYVCHEKEVSYILSLCKLYNFNYLNINKIEVMIETPSACFRISQLIEFGIKKFVIGLNDLTTLMLGSYPRKFHKTIGLHQCCDSIKSIVKNVTNEVIKNQDVKISIAGYFDEEIIATYKNYGFDSFILSSKNILELNC